MNSLDRLALFDRLNRITSVLVAGAGGGFDIYGGGDIAVVTATTRGLDRYFPERTLPAGQRRRWEITAPCNNGWRS